MDINRRKVILRVAFDVVCIACFGIPVLILLLVVTPYQRGFYCDDESLMHPYKGNTIPTWVAGVVGILLPCIAILTIEGLKVCQADKSWKLYTITSYNLLMPFFFGAAVTQLTTDIAKYSIGRLRPHFMAVCDPDVTSCSSSTGYIEGDAVCRGTDTALIEEARVSFPSGHTSVSFYCMIWLMVYLQYRFTWRRSWLLRSVLQAIAFFLAYYVGLSRISDYAHHWSDVLAGAVIGIVSSLLNIFYIANIRHNKKIQCEECRSVLPMYKSCQNSAGKPSSVHAEVAPTTSGTTTTMSV